MTTDVLPPVFEQKEVKKAHHQANVVRISTILPHPDPETTNLELILIDGYQVVVRKGDFKVGDLGVYIQPDSVVPQTEPFRFIWGPYEETVTVMYGGEVLGSAPSIVPEKRRRITVRKFRGQWSEGLLLPVTDFDELVDSTLTRHFVESDYPEGKDVSDLLGITHYDPDAGVEGTKAEQTHAPKRKRPKTLKGWFFYILALLGIRGAHRSYTQEVTFYAPVYDVKAFKNHTIMFQEGDPVEVTEKIHGSNARFVFFDGTMYAGSHRQWKSPDSTCVWRKALVQNPWIEEWCRSHEGYTLYGEVTPTQKGFNYGCENGQVKFFLFDILRPDGTWAELDDFFFDDELLAALIVNTVPVLYSGPFYREKILSLVDGPSHVSGAKNIREGIVIKSFPERRGHSRAQLKIVSNRFLEKDSK